MEQKGLSREGLKLLACFFMLLDHIGAVFLPGKGLRILGRLAFPIFCFQLAEGARRTRSPRRYLLRMLACLLLSEIPYDLLFWGNLTLCHQSVLVTLTLSLLLLLWIPSLPGPAVPFAVVLFSAAGQLLRGSYGAAGVLLCVLFYLTENSPHKFLLQALGMLILTVFSPGIPVILGPVRIPIQLFALPSLGLLAAYHGRTRHTGKVTQLLFYLFYPLHMVLLLLLRG